MSRVQTFSPDDRALSGAYPSAAALVKRFHALGGTQTGILPGPLLQSPFISGRPWNWNFTAEMPHYHRVLFNDPNMQMDYHLAGYGPSAPEAVIRLIGEAVERYAGLTGAFLMSDRVRFESRRQLCRESDKVMPLDLLSILAPEQSKTMAQMNHKFLDRPMNEDDPLGWLKCASLVRPGEDVWIPAQLVLLGYPGIAPADELLTTPVFSTGTASHTTTLAALENALTEIIQIDGMMLYWYGARKARRVIVDDDAVLSLFDGFGIGEGKPFDAHVYEITSPDLPLPSFAAYILGDDPSTPPVMTFGVQAGHDPRRSVARAVQEAMAIHGLVNVRAVFEAELMPEILKMQNFMDLETNVLKYAVEPFDPTILSSRASGEVKLSELGVGEDAPAVDRVRGLVEMIDTVSEWATYCDITPPELEGTDWTVIRAVVPELISMSLPSLPPKAHPRFAQTGGLMHDEPHPLP